MKKVLIIIGLTVVSIALVAGSWYGMFRLMVNSCKTAIEESK